MIVPVGWWGRLDRVNDSIDDLTSGRAGPLGPPKLWQADAAHSVVSIVELRAGDHGCEFALHTSSVELDTRGPHTSLDLRVDLEPVVCARCGRPLHERAGDEVLRWSAAHCVMASATHPNLLVAAGTLTIGSLGRPVELVGSATVHADTLYLHATGVLPQGTRTVAVGPSAARQVSDASLTVTAQLQQHPGQRVTSDQ